MARHVVRTRADTSTDSKPVEGAKLEDGTSIGAPTMPGGSSGIPEEANMMSHVIHGIDDIAPARAVDPERQKTARRFKVTGGPDQVMYDGCRTRVVMGKIFPENAVDLDRLRSQGVQLQELEE
jgi:hypothetical protein